jgi:hypothetical protein
MRHTLKKMVLLLGVVLFFAPQLRAEINAQVVGTHQKGGCLYVDIILIDDQGTDDPSDDEVIGGGTISTGDCAGANDPGTDDEVTTAESSPVEVNPNPVDGPTARIDFKDEEYKSAFIMKINGSSQSIDLRSQGLELKGEERFDATILDEGWYVLLLQDRNGEREAEKFKVE